MMAAFSLRKSINTITGSQSSYISLNASSAGASCKLPKPLQDGVYYEELVGDNGVLEDDESLELLEQNRLLLFSDLSFEVGRGSLTVIRGPSGCGKTTLLRCLAHLDTFDSGRVTLDGVDLLAMCPVAWHLRVAYVPQKIPKFDGSAPRDTLQEISTFKARNTVSFAAMLDCVSGAMRELGLAPRTFHDEWGTLSGGEQQRMLHAIAAALRPEIVLLDEPTAALDAASAACVEQFYLRRRAHLITFWVTHSEEQQRHLQPDLVIDFYRINS